MRSLRAVRTICSLMYSRLLGSACGMTAPVRGAGQRRSRGPRTTGLDNRIVRAALKQGEISLVFRSGAYSSRPYSSTTPTISTSRVFGVLETDVPAKRTHAGKKFLGDRFADDRHLRRTRCIAWSEIAARSNRVPKVLKKPGETLFRKVLFGSPGADVASGAERNSAQQQLAIGV